MMFVCEDIDEKGLDNFRIDIENPKTTFGNILYESVHPCTKEKGLFVVFKSGSTLYVYNAFNERYFPHFWVSKVDGLNGKNVVVNGRKYGFIEYDNSVGVAEGKVVEDVMRVNVWKPYYVSNVREFFRRKGYRTYESDIPFVMRFMIDKGVRPFTNRVLYWDVEADTRAFGNVIEKEKFTDARIVSIVTMDRRGRVRVFADNDEKKLLKSFLNYARKYDLLVGYNTGSSEDIIYNFDQLKKKNIEGFDIPLLSTRMIVNDLRSDILRFWDWFDLYPYFKKVFAGESSDLDSVAMNIVGVGKIGSGKDVMSMEREKLIAYNKMDTYLTALLDEEESLVDILMYKRAVGFVPRMDYFIGSMPQERNNVVVRNLVMWYNVHVDGDRVRLLDGDFERKIGELQGGKVIEPSTGVYRNVVVFDFSSTYPSIIMGAGIDPVSNGAYPYIARFLVDLRKKFKKRMKESRNYSEKMMYDVMQTTMKVIANSMYGVMSFRFAEKNGSKFSVLWDIEKANQVTGLARMALTVIEEKVTEEGYQVLYGDTDSVMLWKKDWEKMSVDSVVSESMELYNRINEWLKEALGFEELKVKVEKVFNPVVFLKKKRYVGRVVWEGDLTSYWLFKGVDIVRKDTPLFVRDYLVELFRLVDQGVDYRNALELVKEKFKNDLVSGKLDRKLVQSKKLTKPVEKYKSKTEHVQAVLNAGLCKGNIKYRVGDRVYFVKSNGKWMPFVPGVCEPKPDYTYYYERGLNTFNRYAV